MYIFIDLKIKNIDSLLLYNCVSSKKKYVRITSGQNEQGFEEV